jgi:methylglyoxal synthase
MHRAIALVAHDAQKPAIVELAREARQALRHHSLVATGTTGGLIAEHLGLEVRCLASGPLGGDLQIGAMVASGDIKLVIFLRDPLSSHAHEPDIQALMKVCDIHHVPLATNRATARLCLHALEHDANRLTLLAGAP